MVDKRLQALKYLSLVTQIGFTMSVPIVLSLIFGNWLDEKIGTSPLFLILFMLIGVYTGFRNSYQLIMKQYKDRKKDNNDR